MEKVNKLIELILAKYGPQMSAITEREDYHPERNLLLHTLSVIDRASLFSKDLMVAALFHDLGKIYTYKVAKNSRTHEITSSWIVMENRELIEEAGVDYDLVYCVTLHHMAFHHHPDKLKLESTADQKYLPALAIFRDCDNMTLDLVTQEEMNNLWLGKQVTVTGLDREMYSGECTYVGVNEFFKYKQVTIGRSPIRIKSFAMVCTKR